MQFRCLLAGVVLMLGGAACDGGDDEASPLTTTSSAVLAPTTTTTAATTTTLDFETEVKLAALDLIERRNEVLMDPDPARVDEYVAETCVCLERERQIIADLAAEGRRWTGPAIEPLGIMMSNPDPAGPTLTVASRQPSGEIRGVTDSESVPQVDRAPYRINLVQNGAGEWRINSLSGVSLDDEVFDEIAAGGLP